MRKIMSTPFTIEQRLTRLEAEVEGLQRQVARNTVKDWHAVVGSFKDDAEFAEILRLGCEIRQADRPTEEE